MRSVTSLTHGRAGPCGRGPIGGRSSVVRGGCRCRALGWPGVQNAGESTGQGGWTGGRTSRFRCGRTGAGRADESGKGGQSRPGRAKAPSSGEDGDVREAPPARPKPRSGRGPQKAAATGEKAAAKAARRPAREAPPRSRSRGPRWSAAPAGSTASSPRCTRTPTPSWTSRTRSSCSSPRSCPPRPPTCGSTRRPPRSSPSTRPPRTWPRPTPRSWRRSSGRPGSSGPRPSPCMGLSAALRDDFGGEVPGPPRGPRHAARRRPQDGQRRARQRLRRARASPWTRTSGGWSAAGSGPSRRTRRRSRRTSPRSSRRASGRCSRTASIFHGRRICHARKPACGACPIAPLCPAYGEGETDPEKAKKLLKYEKGGFPGQRLNPPRRLPGAARPAAGRRMTPADGSDGRADRTRAGTAADDGGADDDARSDGRATRQRADDERRHGAAIDVTPTACPTGWTRSRAPRETVEPQQLSRFLPPANGAGRQSAVLILFGEGERGPELLLMERAGSPALARRASRPSPAAPSTRRTATRTATGRCGPRCARPRRRPASIRRGVQLFGVLPRLYIPVSGFVVTPVLGWWREPEPGRRRRPGRDRPGLHRPRGGSHGPGQPRDHRPPQRPPRPGIPGRIRPGLGLHGRSDRPDPALRGLGAPLGPRRSRSRSTGAHDRVTPVLRCPGLARTASNRTGQVTNLRGYRR